MDHNTLRDVRDAYEKLYPKDFGQWLSDHLNAAAPVGETPATEVLPWKCPHCDRHYTRSGETPEEK